MIVIDGSQGEGGGQIIRSSLTLALITGQPVQIHHVRAKRSKPGLLRQHLTAVRAAAEIGDARIVGDKVGSAEIVFEPSGIRAGEYHFRIGTAGSTTLVLQSVLPALCLAEAPSTIRLEGGTHNAWAPPFDFLEHVYIPLLNRIGPAISVELKRYGFHPAGGGDLAARVQPAKRFRGLSILERGKTIARELTAIVSHLPGHIAEREVDKFLQLSRWRKKSDRVDCRAVESAGPGNIVLARVTSENICELFSQPGQRGVKAEQVARTVWKQVQAYENGTAPVGPHLADQLILPLGIAALHGQTSAFRTVALTEHSTTHIDILQQFLDIQIAVEPLDGGDVVVKFHS